MLTTRTLPFLSGRRALNRYRDELAARIGAEPAARLLAGLLSVPLGAAPLPDPTATLARRAALALLGPPASGRSLALIQTAARWAAGDGDAPTLYLPLLTADAPNLSPRAIVAGATHRAGLPPAFTDGGRAGLLLVDDWEQLSADRRALWRSYLEGGAANWTGLRPVVALPPGEQWAGFTALGITLPDDDQLGAWLAHLLPSQEVAPIIGALAREPLASLRGSLTDLALVALVYPLAGLPGSRAQLYEQAYALARPLLSQAARGTQPLDEEGSRPAAATLGPWPEVTIGRALLRHYRLARALAGGDDLETLADLGAVERAAVAPLAAGLLDDPTPVLAPLWANADDPASLRALVVCAREAPARAPLLGLRLASRLAKSEGAPEEQALLAELAPCLPIILAAAARSDEPAAVATLLGVARALPDARALCLALGDDAGAPARLRWAAADLLATTPPEAGALAATPADATPEALAPRAYVAAVGAPTLRATLAEGALAGALPALFADPDAGGRRVAAARVIVLDHTLPEVLRAAALAHAGVDLLEQAAGAASPGLRRAAQGALAAAEPTAAVAALARALAHPEADLRARHEALDVIARVAHPTAVAALTRATLDAGLPLGARIRAADLLAGKGAEGAHLLGRVLATPALPAPVRAAAAGHLGRLGVGEALPTIAALLIAPDEPLLRRAAAVALGAMARRPELRERAVAALIAGLRRAAADAALGERIARALGNSAAPAALPALASLLAPGLADALVAAWRRLAPSLERTPAFAWPTLDLPLPTRLALADALAEGGTLADPPSRLAELAARQATRLAAAAADGLAELAAAPELRAGILAALRRAAQAERPEVARAVLAALARVGDPAAELGSILDDPEATPSLRWLAIEAMGHGHAALELLRRRLERAADEPFVQTMIAAALGAGLHAPALPTLHRVACGDTYDLHLRRAAVAALGRLDHPDAAPALVSIIADQALPLELRAAAATALPNALGPSERVTLRQAMRVDNEAGALRLRQPAELTASIARALAHAGEGEALPTLIRSAQGDTGAEAMASIEALAALGDQSTTPVLVRVSQSPMAPQGVRLAAVAALLRLGGAEYEPLLREYLASASPPLRLQAYAALAAVFPDDVRLAEPLADPSAPLALRLQALAHLAAHHPEAAIIAAVLAAPDEHPQIRLDASATLARSATSTAVAALAAALAPPLPATEPAPPILRRRCAHSLGAIARRAVPAAEEARVRLSILAADPDQTPEHRHWAAESLLGC